MSVNRLVKMYQEQKRKDLLAKVGKAFTFLNRLAVRQKCNSAFRKFQLNIQLSNMEEVMKNKQKEWDGNFQKSEIAVKRDLELKIQEYENKLSVLKLSHGKLENENEELRDEAEELRGTNEHSQLQNKVLNDRVAALEQQLDKLEEEKLDTQKQIKDLNRIKTSLEQTISGKFNVKN